MQKDPYITYRIRAAMLERSKENTELCLNEPL